MHVSWYTYMYVPIGTMKFTYIYVFFEYNHATTTNNHSLALAQYTTIQNHFNLETYSPAWITAHIVDIILHKMIICASWYTHADLPHLIIYLMVQWIFCTIKSENCSTCQFKTAFVKATGGLTTQMTLYTMMAIPFDIQTFHVSIKIFQNCIQYSEFNQCFVCFPRATGQRMKRSASCSTSCPPADQRPLTNSARPCWSVIMLMWGTTSKPLKVGGILNQS